MTKVNTHRIADQIRYYVEVEALTDREIAVRLHVGTSTVNTWRRRARIPYAQSWRRRFERDYGGAKGGEDGDAATGTGHRDAARSGKTRPELAGGGGGEGRHGGSHPSLTMPAGCAART